MRLMLVCLLCVLASCGQVVVSTGNTQPTPSAQPQQTRPAQTLSTAQIRSNFQTVQRRMEPIAEALCRKETQGLNCDFRIEVDRNPNAPSNAYQTLGRNGRPLIVFTENLLKEMRNIHELAFVMGHEAAHHIENHIGRQRTAATVGGLIAGQLASIAGAQVEGVRQAQNAGAAIGARSYSKSFELEADRLGTRITAASGFDPLIGAKFFDRIPDPGDQFLGTHPPNSDRIRAVQNEAAKLGL